VSKVEFYQFSYYKEGDTVAGMQALTEKVNKFFSIKGFNVIAFALIAACILVAYSNTFHAVFHFDDNPSIVENPNIKYMNMDTIISLLKGVRPVVYLSLMINYRFSTMDPFGYHVFNVGVHIITSFLVYLLVSQTLSLPVFKGNYADRAKRMGLFAGLLFGVHPIQTEAVTYIISRTELLATVFYVAAFLLFTRGIQKRKPVYYIGGFISALLSMMSKEWAVTLPAMIMLYDYLFLSDKKVSTVLSHWLAFVLAALPWISVYHSLNLTSNPSVGFNMVSSSGGTTPPTVITYLLTSFNVLWTYIRLLVLPIHQNLDYEYPIAKTLFEFPTLLSFLGHIAVVVMAFWLFKKKGWLLVPFGIAWFYIGISPVHSFVPVMDIIFEHRVYMPSIGFFIVFVVAFEDIFEWFSERAALKKAKTA
jgi:hypothetical protein